METPLQVFQDRPDRVDREYLAKLLIDECLTPEAGPEVASAIISMLIAAGSLVPSAHTGVAFARRPKESTTDLPPIVANAVLEEFRQLIDLEHSRFGQRVGRLVRADTIPADCKGSWDNLHDDYGPNVTTLDAARDLLVVAQREKKLLHWHRADVAREFADPSLGCVFAAFLLRDAERRISWLECEIRGFEQLRVEIQNQINEFDSDSGGPFSQEGATPGPPPQIARSRPLAVSTTITRVTRRAIIQAIVEGGFDWKGAMREVEFLSPLWDLTSMPSTDSRAKFKNAADDIWQHCENNRDWPPDWIFEDSRFDPLRPDSTDDEFLRFLCRTLDPEVRLEASAARRWGAVFNGFLKEDGWQLVEEQFISGRPVFAPKRGLEKPQSPVLQRTEPPPTPPSPTPPEDTNVQRTIRPGGALTHERVDAPPDGAATPGITESSESIAVRTSTTHRPKSALPRRSASGSGPRALRWEVDPDSAALSIGDSELGTVFTVKKGTVVWAIVRVLHQISLGGNTPVTWAALIRSVDVMLSASGPPGAAGSPSWAAGGARTETTTWEEPDTEDGVRDRRFWKAGTSKHYEDLPEATAINRLRACFSKTKTSDGGRAWYDYWIHDEAGQIRFGPPQRS